MSNMISCRASADLAPSHNHLFSPELVLVHSIIMNHEKFHEAYKFFRWYKQEVEDKLPPFEILESSDDELPPEDHTLLTPPRSPYSPPKYPGPDYGRIRCLYHICSTNVAPEPSSPTQPHHAAPQPDPQNTANRHSSESSTAKIEAWRRTWMPAAYLRSTRYYRCCRYLHSLIGVDIECSRA